MPHPVEWFANGIDPLLPGKKEVSIKPYLYYYDEYQTYDLFFVERMSDAIRLHIFNEMPPNFLAKPIEVTERIYNVKDPNNPNNLLLRSDHKYCFLFERFTPWEYPWADNYTEQIFKFFEPFSGTDYYDNAYATGTSDPIQVGHYVYERQWNFDSYTENFGPQDLSPIFNTALAWQTNDEIELTLPATKKQERIVITYLYGDIDNCYKKLYKSYQTFNQPRIIKFNFKDCLLCSVVVSSTDNKIKNSIDQQFNQASKGYLYDNLDELLGFARTALLANYPRLYKILTTINLDAYFTNHPVVTHDDTNSGWTHVSPEYYFHGYYINSVLYEPRPDWYRFAGVYYANNNHWKNGSVKSDLGVAHSINENMNPFQSFQNWFHNTSYLEKLEVKSTKIGDIWRSHAEPGLHVTYNGSNDIAEGTDTYTYNIVGSHIFASGSQEPLRINSEPGAGLVKSTYGNSCFVYGSANFYGQPTGEVSLYYKLFGFFAYTRVEQNLSINVMQDYFLHYGDQYWKKERFQEIEFMSGNATDANLDRTIKITIGRSLRHSIQPFEDPYKQFYQDAIASADAKHYNENNFKDEQIFLKRIDNQLWYSYSKDSQGITLNLMPDTIRIKEIHQALDAQKFAYDETQNDEKRTANLGYYVERISRVLGISVNPDGSIRSIRQKAKHPAGLPMPAGWEFAQFGLNQGGSLFGQKGGENNEQRDGIAYESRSNKVIPNKYDPKKSKIVGGDITLCENLPQLLDEILDDLDKALGWQELGASAIPAADSSGGFATFEGLAALQAELAYMLSKISIDTSQGLISNLIVQAVSYEILAAFGQPVKTKTFAMKVDKNRTGQVPYPGLADDAPSVMMQTGWILQNLAPVVGSLLKRKEIEKPEVQNKNKIQVEKERTEKTQKENEGIEGLAKKAKEAFEKLIKD